MSSTDKSSTRITFNEVLQETYRSLLFNKQNLKKDIAETYKHLTFIATSANCMAKVPLPKRLLADLYEYLDLGSDADNFAHEDTGAEVLSSAIECLQAVSSVKQNKDGIEVEPIFRDDEGSYPESMLDHGTVQELRRLAGGLVDQLRQLQSAQKRIKSDLSVFFAFDDDEDTEGSREGSASPRH